MFGCIVAGRLVQTNLQQVDVNKYIFELSDAQAINHIVVFLLGTIPFDPGFGATVHFLWPNKDWQLLGALSNDKPSAIFRLKQNGQQQQQLGDDTTMQVSTTATLGISIEPMDVIQQQLASLNNNKDTTSMDATPTTTAIIRPSTTLNLNQAAQLATRILENLYNYVMSFAVQDLPVSAIPLGTITERGFLPVKTFQTWYENLTRKLSNDPSYLSTEKTA